MLKLFKAIFSKNNKPDNLLARNRLRFDNIISDRRFNFLESIYQGFMTKTLIRRGLLSIVYSLGDDIDCLTVGQFIDKRILAENAEPYGGLPPNAGQDWLRNLMASQKETVQRVLVDVIEENGKAIEKI